MKEDDVFSPHEIELEDESADDKSLGFSLEKEIEANLDESSRSHFGDSSLELLNSVRRGNKNDNSESQPKILIIDDEPFNISAL